MNNIEVTGRVFPCYKKLAKQVANLVLKEMNQPDGLEIAIEFVSEKEIQRLNNEMRSIDKVTDVLSFPSINLKVGEILNLEDVDVQFLKTDLGFVHFGDMAICFKQTKRQAKEFSPQTHFAFFARAALCCKGPRAQRKARGRKGGSGFSLGRLPFLKAHATPAQLLRKKPSVRAILFFL